jgi:hydrogenase expression/formation protein HypE
MQDKFGKIERENLEKIFTRQTGAFCSNILQGPKFGVDTAIVRLSENKGLVIASDPTSLIPALGLKESAWLSVILTANDVATSGFLPHYAQFVLNLPNDISNADLEQYWQHIHFFCSDIGISITGGHTGFGDIGKSTIAGGVTMFAEADLSQIKSTAYTKPNLDLIVTKSAALSAAAILARSFPNYTAHHLGHQTQQELMNTFYQMAIFKEVEAIRSKSSIFKSVVAMHDVTEGGILGAVLELAEAGEVGVTIRQELIPLGDNQKKLCELFEIDPYQSLGAGSLLIACEKEITQDLIVLLKNEGIDANKIGETTENKDERYIICEGKKQKLNYTDEDPYWGTFFTAMAKNLD